LQTCASGRGVPVTNFSKFPLHPFWSELWRTRRQKSAKLIKSLIPDDGICLSTWVRCLPYSIGALGVFSPLLLSVHLLGEPEFSRVPHLNGYRVRLPPFCASLPCMQHSLCLILIHHTVCVRNISVLTWLLAVVFWNSGWEIQQQTSLEARSPWRATPVSLNLSWHKRWHLPFK